MKSIFNCLLRFVSGIQLFKQWHLSVHAAGLDPVCGTLLEQLMLGLPVRVNVLYGVSIFPPDADLQVMIVSYADVHCVVCEANSELPVTFTAPT
jgi:hypothetical protein